jgi:hypothetical protein
MAHAPEPARAHLHALIANFPQYKSSAPNRFEKITAASKFGPRGVSPGIGASVFFLDISSPRKPLVTT